VNGDFCISAGSDGDPERALASAIERAKVNSDVIGVEIHDVRTGEKWLYPLPKCEHDRCAPTTGGRIVCLDCAEYVAA
jgi:hypothetical protein